MCSIPTVQYTAIHLLSCKDRDRITLYYYYEAGNRQTKKSFKHTLILTHTHSHIDAGLKQQGNSRRWSTAVPMKGAFPLAIDRQSNIVLHAACSTVWRKVQDPSGNAKDDNVTSSTSSSSLSRTTSTPARGGSTAAAAAAAGPGQGGKAGSGLRGEIAAMYVPRCVCALSFDPLFDTLRAVALARGGFPEAGRALMLEGTGTAGGVGRKMTGAVSANPDGSRPDRNSSTDRKYSNDLDGRGGVSGAGGVPTGGGDFGAGGIRSSRIRDGQMVAPRAGTYENADRVSQEYRARGPVQWGLGDAATLQAAPLPLPLWPPTEQPPGPTLSTVFAPSIAASPAAGSSAGGAYMPASTAHRAALVRSISAPDSTGGWSVDEEGGVGGRGAWSSFGLPPLVPLDHPVEPLFQVRRRSKTGRGGAFGGRGGAALALWC